METKKVENLSMLSKTLFIPLVVRAQESDAKKPVVIDKVAEEIVKQFGAEPFATNGGELSTHGILARTKVMDTETKKFLMQNPHTTVINLGAGLDTRYSRVDNGTVKWYDLDLPEVISLRKQFISESDRLHFIAQSIQSIQWAAEIKRSEDSPVLIIAEGLLMYFSEEDVTKILDHLVAAFPNADMLLDVVHTYFIKKKIISDFLWGIDNAQALEKLNSNIKVLQSWSTGNLLKERQPPLLRFLNMFSSTRNRSQIIHLKWRAEC